MLVGKAIMRGASLMITKDDLACLISLSWAKEFDVIGLKGGGSGYLQEKVTLYALLYLTSLHSNDNDSQLVNDYRLEHDRKVGLNFFSIAFVLGSCG
jgi:hypothetical protein